MAKGNRTDQLPTVGRDIETNVEWSRHAGKECGNSVGMKPYNL